eukprot:g20529.t1
MPVNSDYDWRGYFEQCRNKHLKHYKRPLAYQNEAGDVASKYLPGVRYKVWGHAEQKWRGENDSVEGKDLRPYVQPPNPAHRPEKLPPVPWVTEEISKNVRKVAQKYCSAQEREWFEDILKDGHLLNEKWIFWDGEEGAGGLAGRPAHFTCTDAAGKQWQVNIRVLDVLPADLWAVPSDREARISAEYLLSEEERLRMPRVNFRNDGTAPPHPAWRGCRLLDASEVWDFNNPPPPDADKVDRLLQSGAPALAKATVAQLKAWLAVHRQTVTGRKATLIDAVYVHSLNCECKTGNLVPKCPSYASPTSVYTLLSTNMLLPATEPLEPASMAMSTWPTKHPLARGHYQQPVEPTAPLHSTHTAPAGAPAPSAPPELQPPVGPFPQVRVPNHQLLTVCDVPQLKLAVPLSPISVRSTASSRCDVPLVSWLDALL